MPRTHLRVQNDIVDIDIAPRNNVCILYEGNADVLLRIDFADVHAANAAVHNDIAPRHLSTADHALDLDITVSLDRKAALYITPDLDAAGKVNIPRPDIDTRVNHEMRIHTDLLSVVYDLTVNERHEFMLIDNSCILPLRQCSRFSRLCRHLFTEYIFPRHTRGLGDAYSKHVADVRADKDVHVLVVHAVVRAFSRPSLCPHIEFLFDTCIRSRLGSGSACRHKRCQTCDTAPDGITVNAIDDLLCGECIEHIGDIGRHIAAVVIKPHGSCHCVVCDFNAKGNDCILAVILRCRVELCLKSVRSTDKTCQLEFVVILDTLLCKTTLECRQINRRGILASRVDGQIIAVRLDHKLKPFVYASNSALHNITSDPS